MAEDARRFQEVAFSFDMLSAQRTPNLRSTLIGFVTLLVLLILTSIIHGLVQGFVVVTKSAHLVAIALRVTRHRHRSSHGPERRRLPPPFHFHLHQNQQHEPDAPNRFDAPEAETYESTDFASKGVVAVLTTLVNGVAERMPAALPTEPSNSLPFLRPSSGRNETNAIDAVDGPTLQQRPGPHRGPPRTPEELLDRIRDDYSVHNYLWTGNLDVSCFDPDCEFQDPTISFRGTGRFVRNVKNLRPIVDALVTTCRSDVLGISLNRVDGYVQTRWNMVGDLHRLPWRPRIDVVGRTKFWYRSVPRPLNDKDGFAFDVDEKAPAIAVVRYDEEWEIPAYRALLQLVTPGALEREGGCGP